MQQCWGNDYDQEGQLSAVALDLAPLNNIRAINAIYKDKWIKKRIEQDVWQPKYLDKAFYIGAFVNGKLVGHFALIQTRQTEIEIHACLKKEATNFGRYFGVSCLMYVFRNSSIMRATAPILSDLPSAVNYCKKLGFMQEGIKRNTVYKNGKLINTVIMGMTRQEYEVLYE